MLFSFNKKTNFLALITKRIELIEKRKVRFFLQKIKKIEDLKRNWLKSYSLSINECLKFRFKNVSLTDF